MKEIQSTNNVTGNITGNYDCDNDQYPEFSKSIKTRVSSILANGVNVPLFTTDAVGLFNLFLSHMSDEGRQHYNCRTCGHFVNRFGGLVTISDTGEITPLLWDDKDVPKFFVSSVKEMKKIVSKAKITGVFLPEGKTLGVPTTGEWNHMSATLPSGMVYRPTGLKNASQKMAEKLQDFEILTSALSYYSIGNVEKAVALLKADLLNRTDRFLGVAEWLKDLYVKRSNTKNINSRNNITWLAVAKAPEGYCHVKSSVVGSLLDDISENLSHDSIIHRFKEKTNSTNYMRSTVAPTEGNKQQAERIVVEMGIANSLIRRFATFEEIPHFIWENRTVVRGQRRNADLIEEKANGVFGNIITKSKVVHTSNEVSLPSTIMTWDKFQRTVLPTAEKIEVKVDNTNRLMALVTASFEDSPNILQWDNTFSWYYHGGVDGEIQRRVEGAGGQYTNNEIRCSLIWDGYTDLDLHVITPSGQHIHYPTSSRRSRCGGWLDVDANGMDGKTMTPVENVRWSNGMAKEGKYRFYVYNYAERGKGSTSFKGELEINGKIYTFSGELRNNEQVDIFVFNYIKGQNPSISGNSYSSSNSWNIQTNDFIKVNGITNSPNLWGKEPVIHSGNHIFFLLDGCKDLSEGKGRGFFNEMLKSDYREIRKTLEAYTANTPIQDVDLASACGVGYSKDSEWDLTIKVKSEGSNRIIKVDRFD